MPTTKSNITHYTYDNMDRLLETKHGWYDKDKITLVGNSYNDLGQLSNRAINGKIGVGYSYNIRGWVNSITCPKVGFLQNLRYETKSNGEYGCLDGNICEMSWRVKDPTFGADNITRTYDYTYDNVDRLLAADYKEDKERNGVAMNMLFINAPDYSTSYTYDLNSNITSLNRKGLLYKDGYNQGIWVYGTIDSLKYQREGNKLLNVSDMAHSDPIYNGAFNFNDYNDDGTEYEYDANGNITQDYNKGIAWVEYNYLNLPAVIRFTSGQVIEYVYDATGVKRSAIYKVQPEALFAPIESVEASTATAEHLEVQSRKDYCDNHIYNENGALTMVLVDNGYIESDKYYFYITDYQGNNRVVIDQDGVTEQVNHYYPYGGIFGEGLASSVQPYKFGGKELDRMNGLDWSDFGARMLDSPSGLWGSIDPMAEKYYATSPYAYCAGNPILYVDPSGMVIMIGNLQYQIGMTYRGKDAFTRQMVDALNVISEYGGGKLVTDLIESGTTYNYKENNTEQSSYTVQQKDGSVDINLNTTGGRDNFYSAVAHESMHGAQYENGQGGASIWNEVEAYAFQQYISSNTFIESSSHKFFSGAASVNPQSGNIGEMYAQSILNLGISYSAFDKGVAVLTFKYGSAANSDGKYNSNPIFPQIQNKRGLKSILKLYSK